MELSIADALVLLGTPIVATILVALVFVLIVRTRVDTPLSRAATLIMNEDGSLTEAFEPEVVHALAA